MKKVIVFFALTVFILQMAVAGDVVTKDISKLPTLARETISKHFPQLNVSYIKIDKDIFQSPTYEATLTDGTEIEFDSRGEWVDVDCKKNEVPDTFIPSTVAKYVRDNFAGQTIVQIERGRKGYQVELSNGLEVKFDTFGGFLKLDD